MGFGLLNTLPLAQGLGIVSALILILSLFALFIKKGRTSVGKGANTVSKPASSNQKGVKHKEEDNREKATIVFGTQTGTAERFAKSLRVELDAKYGSHTSFELVDIENYDYEQQLSKEKLIFFLMATYGDGEPTDSATEFMDWLTNSRQADDTDDLMQVWNTVVRYIYPQKLEIV